MQLLNSNNYLSSVTGAQTGSTSSFTFDGFGRVRTTTEAIAEAGVLTEAAVELSAIVEELGITDATIGIRGSSVTGFSFKTGLAFKIESDLDFFIESNQLLRGLVTNSKGMVYSSILEDAFPEIATWSTRWSAILQRDVNVAGWLLGRVPFGLFF